MKLFTTFLLVTSLASAQFYVKDQQYRFPKGDDRCDQKKLCDYEEHSAGEGHDFSINFVELRGNGQPFDAQQLIKAKEQMEKATFKDPQTHQARQKPLVFVYIHGWHNNAGEVANPVSPICPDIKGDVAKFRDCGLAMLAKDYKTLKGAPPSVVGIYLAWQGTDFTPWGLVTYIVPSYMLRRYAADRVGMTGMCTALGEILDKAGKDREQYTVAVMGHSFGARVLENALQTIDPDRKCGENPLMRHRNAVAGVAKGQNSPAVNAAPGVKQEPPADLIFYVNAAAPNTFTRRTIKDWNDVCSKAKTEDNPICSANPFYVTATSRTDVGTGLVMFVANVAFFWWPASPSKPFFELTPLSAANSFWMHTHHDPKNIKTQKCPATDESALCFSAPASPKSLNSAVDTYDLEPLKKNTPRRFWVMNTGHRFIANHADVWNPKVFAMFQALLQQHPKYKTGNASNQKARAAQ